MATIDVQSGPHGAVTIWLDNPSKRNALTEGMLRALVHAIEHQATCPETRLIVIRGRAGMFCAGRDVSDLQADGTEEKQRGMDLVGPAVQLAHALLNCPVPTVAAVSGRAIGLGVGIAVWCDLAVADQSASFSIPEARLGIPPSMTAWSLARVIGLRNAADWVLRGRTIPAQEAWQSGLLSQLLDDEDALSQALDVVAHDIYCGGPVALRVSKALMRELDGHSFMQGFERATEVAANSLSSEEAREGMQAFREKRPPAWRI